MLMGHPVFWLLLAAVAAPLLAEIPVGLRVPVAVFEVVLGIVIGPQVLGLVPFEGFIAAMFTFGMAASLFMAGMELDFGRIRGRPLSLALGGWVLSAGLGCSPCCCFQRWPGYSSPSGRRRYPAPLPSKAQPGLPVPRGTIPKEGSCAGVSVSLPRWSVGARTRGWPSAILAR